MNQLPECFKKGLDEVLAKLTRAREEVGDSMLEPFPQEAIDALAGLNTQAYYIPSQQGGALQSLTQLVALWRQLASYDLTAAIGHGKTFLGSICVWVGGSAQQKNKVRQWLGDQLPISWGLTERDHGADLMASDTYAEAMETGWLLNGEKWLINNANRCQAMTVLARTAYDQGGRNLSLFLVDKSDLSSQQYTPLSKIHTHGIRGADISGIAFDSAKLPQDALIGNLGSGLEITIKALQITRVACCALSVGALEGALDTALRFAHHHHLYSKALISLDTVQETLSEALITLWYSEMTTWHSARTADCMPTELSIVSALTKASIPSRVACQLALLEEQMGARGFITDLPYAEWFEKRVRDHQIVPIFDGSTLVNRASLVPHIKALIRHFQNGDYDQEGLEALAEKDTSEGIPFEQLSLLSRQGCSVVQAIPDRVRQIQDEIRNESLASEVSAFLSSAEFVIEKLSRVPVQHPDVPFQTLHAIEDYEWLFIGACCLNYTICVENVGTAVIDKWDRLALCLNHINRKLHEERASSHHVCPEKAYLKEQLVAHAEFDFYSVFAA